jgi:cell division protein FtsB
MKNFLVLFFSSLIFFTIVKAQSYKGTYNFQKNLYPAAVIQVSYEEDVVTDAVKEYMAKKGYKDSHYKDFIVYRSVPLEENPGSTVDAYFNINQKSRSEKDVTIISLIPVKKGETLVPANEEDSSFVQKSVVFLDSMRYNLLSYSLKQQIAAQQKSVDKIKSKMVDLKNDSGDIAKKIRSYDSDLQQNKLDQDKLTQDISKIPTGDASSLAKAHKKMDKLMDNQADYEKKLRNYKSDLEKNTGDRATQQSIFETANSELESLKKRLENLK